VFVIGLFLSSFNYNLLTKEAVQPVVCRSASFDGTKMQIHVGGGGRLSFFSRIWPGNGGNVPLKGNRKQIGLVKKGV
jgi:hypothetical protein